MQFRGHLLQEAFLDSSTPSLGEELQGTESIHCSMAAWGTNRPRQQKACYRQGPVQADRGGYQRVRVFPASTLQASQTRGPFHGDGCFLPSLGHVPLTCSHGFATKKCIKAQDWQGRCGPPWAVPPSRISDGWPGPGLTPPPPCKGADKDAGLPVGISAKTPALSYRRPFEPQGSEKREAAPKPYTFLGITTGDAPILPCDTFLEPKGVPPHGHQSQE